MSSSSFLYNGEIYEIGEDNILRSGGVPYISISPDGTFQFAGNVGDVRSSFVSALANDTQLQQNILTAYGKVQSNVATTDSNPDSQSGSTPLTEETTTLSGSAGGLRYPLLMEDGQDKIKFVPLEIIKVNFEEGGQISIKRPTYKPLTEDTINIGIQGSITDGNSVSWGSGELNEVQKSLANFSLDFMNNPNSAMEDLQKRLSDAFKDKAILSTARGMGQLYFAEQATGVGGLLSRTTGQILNPNLELLFQNPTLRTFQFQFKMSPRNKNEADAVKKIIKTFKRHMAPKKGLDPSLFLGAPNVFKIQYLKGMQDHKSINLIKECALLNFSVDYTPNGSYMTFGGGTDGDPEASMVTYNLSMAFQEIEPIYDRDYIDGEGKDHPIGF